LNGRTERKERTGRATSSGPVLTQSFENTVLNWVIIARGTVELFEEIKRAIADKGGSIVYQKVSGYQFRVKEILPQPEPEEEPAQ
jgi:hypothetical protein